MMSEQGLKAMLQRGHRDVKITNGHFANMTGTVQPTPLVGGWCFVDIPGRGRVEFHLSDLAPAYPQAEAEPDGKRGDCAGMTKQEVDAMLARGVSRFRVRIGPHKGKVATIHDWHHAYAKYIVALDETATRWLFGPCDLELMPATDPMTQELTPSLRDIELTEADVEAICQAAQEGPSEVVRRMRREPYQAPVPAPDMLREYNDPRQREVRESAAKPRWHFGDFVLTNKPPVEGKPVILLIGRQYGRNWVAVVENKPGAPVFAVNEADFVRPATASEIFAQNRPEGGPELRQASPLGDPASAATIETTLLGALAWQKTRPADRRIHFSVTGHVLEVHATRLSSNYATRKVKFLDYLPANEVPAKIDAAFADPAPAHLTVGCGYDGITDLFGEVG